MRSFFVCIWLLLSFASRATIIQWDGGGADGLWNTAANWTGDRVPATGDDVVLDNSFLPGNYTVNLPGGSDSVVIQSLVITPAASSFIVLVLPATSIRDSCLIITGASYALVLNRGAVLKNSSRASKGTSLIIADSFRINNGARYIHNTNTGNLEIVSRLSKAAGTELGTFEFDVPAASYTLSLSGRTFGTLELSSTASPGITNYTGTGASQLNINGDLLMNADADFSLGMSAPVVVHRHLKILPGCVFNLQNSNNNNMVKILGDVSVEGTITELGNGLPVLELNGNTLQQVFITGVIQNSICFSMNNSAGASLQSPLVLPFQLQLLNGKLKTDAINLLTLTDKAIYTGGSSKSFVEGPMKKVGDENFIFPVGKGSIYAPVGIAGAGTATDEFIAEYMRSNPQSVPGLGNNYTSPLDHISNVEFWKLDRVAGNSSRTISLAVSALSFATTATNLLVAAFNGVQWHSEGNAGFVAGAPVPPYITGTLSAALPVNVFGAFTVGTSDPVQVNPLPVGLLSFNVVAQQNRLLFNWRVADNTSLLKFEIQGATGDRLFQTVGVVDAEISRNQYEYSMPEGRYRLFRLKIIEMTGSGSYSKIVAINSSQSGISRISLFPDPAGSKLHISIVSVGEQPLVLRVIDMHGRILKTEHYGLLPGPTTISLSIDDLAAGLYWLSATTATEKIYPIRFTRL